MNDNQLPEQDMSFPPFVQPIFEDSQPQELQDAHERPGHTHEYSAVCAYAAENFPQHNHRFTGLSGPSLPEGRSHVHMVESRSDYAGRHFHSISAKSGPALYVCENKHIHLVTCVTSEYSGHNHQIIFTTSVNDPMTIR